MTTRYVITECCQAPVRLAFPDFAAECADVVCCRCLATAGRPGAEDSPDVDEFLTVVFRTDMLTRPVMRA